MRRVLGIGVALSLCAGAVAAQLPDSIVRPRMDSASMCPQVFVRHDAELQSWTIETSPITSRVGGRDLALVAGASFLPAGLGTIGMIQFMSMGEGIHYAAAHDIAILADDSIRIPLATKYEDQSPSAGVHFETIVGQIHSYDLARLAKAKQITLNLGNESHPLSIGQVQAVRALVKAMAEPLSEREVITGCAGPNRAQLQAKWDSLNAQLSHPSRVVIRNGNVPVRAPGGVTYFEFQVEKPATVINRGVMVFPPDMKAAKISGRVLAQFVVLPDGTADMETFKVLSSTNDQFTQAAKATVPTMRFGPAEIGGKMVAQLVQLPFEFSFSSLPKDSIARPLPILPPSASQTVYTETQVDKPVRGPNGSPLPKTVPPEVVAMFGGEVLLEFVVNADGSVEPTTVKIVSSTDPVMAAAAAKNVSMHFIPAELGGKSVRQLVRMAMPMGKNPFH